MRQAVWMQVGDNCGGLARNNDEGRPLSTSLGGGC